MGFLVLPKLVYGFSPLFGSAVKMMYHFPSILWSSGALFMLSMMPLNIEASWPPTTSRSSKVVLTIRDISKVCHLASENSFSIQVDRKQA